MLSSYILTRCNIRPISGMLVQWLNVTVRLCSSSSSSDSSDSDSDSDSEKAKPKKPDAERSRDASEQTTKHSESTKAERVTQKEEATTTETSKPAADLNEYLNNMLKARKLEKTIDVALKPKSKRLLNKVKSIPYEKQVRKAAENVAEKLGGDKTKTTSDLLEKVLASRIDALKSAQSEKINKLQKDKKLQQMSEYEGQEKSHQEKKSVITTLLQEYNKGKATSVSRKISSKHEISSRLLSNQDIDIWNGEPSQQFNDMGPTPSNVPELKTWTKLEQNELKALTTYPPANIFQEMIMWTEQGKLWKFPIDNEQGMEEEHKVHFSEHVFMERHLKEWCPKTGPVRHFMELVCNGLSKNPYMTVEEKVNHIMWYKEYFESKRDLLREIETIEQPASNKISAIQEA